MTFEFSEKTKELQKRLQRFMDEHIYPNEERYYAQTRTHAPSVSPTARTKCIATRSGGWSWRSTPEP